MGYADADVFAPPPSPPSLPLLHAIAAATDERDDLANRFWPYDKGKMSIFEPVFYVTHLSK